MNRLRALIYDAAIAHMTTGWYRAVLARLPEHCRVLDIGIGTGRALLDNADEVVRKDLHVTGIDIDADYVARCQRQVARRGFEGRVDVRHESVYDHAGGPYDAAYFSGSFMLLPDPQRALRHVGRLLAPEGRMYFTQTFERQRSSALETLKPLLRVLTTIDFGRVTYEPEFRRVLAAGGIELEALEILSGGQRRSAVLVIGRRQALQPRNCAHSDPEMLTTTG